MKKGLIFLIILISSFFCSIEIDAASSIFLWDIVEIDVPYSKSIEDYIDLVTNSITLKSGYNDPDFYVENNGINYTFQHVINTNVLKTYYLYFKAISPKYNKSEEKKILFNVVDVTPPKIKSSMPIYLSLGDKKPNYLNYITYEDDTASVEEITVTINDLAVDLNTVGVYEVIYNLVDLFGNQTIHQEKVYVKDTVKPTITKISGAKYIVGSYFNIYNFFEVKDNYDKNCSLKYTFGDTLNEPGIVNVFLEAEDSSGNIGSLNSFIEVIVDNPPKIISSSPFYLLVGEKKPNYLNYLIYEDDLTPTKDIVVSVDDSAVNYNLLGEYEIIYKLIDNSGNTVFYKEFVYIQDLLGPTIQKIENKNHQQYTPFNIYDYFQVEDNYDSYVSLDYVLKGDIDEVGRVEIYLFAVDSSNNKTELNSYIDVVSNIDLKIYLTTNKVQIDVNSEELDLISFVDYNLTHEIVSNNITIQDNINYNKTGNYEVVYSFETDNYEQISEVLIVYIVDKVPPTIEVANKEISQYETIDLFKDVIVNDNYSSKENIKLTIFNSNLNVDIPGVYFITYEAVDEAGNYTYKTISVIVAANKESNYKYLYIALVGTAIIVGSVAGYFIYKKNKQKAKF